MAMNVYRHSRLQPQCMSTQKIRTSRGIDARRERAGGGGGGSPKRFYRCGDRRRQSLLCSLFLISRQLRPNILVWQHVVVVTPLRDVLSTLYACLRHSVLPSSLLVKIREIRAWLIIRMIRPGTATTIPSRLDSYFRFQGYTHAS